MWGASTSAFQIEGGFDEGGKGPATTDIGTGNPDIADNKIASDHYHHWKEDVDLMAEMGMKITEWDSRGVVLCQMQQADRIKKD